MQQSALVVPGMPPAHDSFWSAQMEGMLRASPAYFANRMLIGAKEAPYNGRFVISWHHLEWDALAMTGDNLCLIASRNSGKSLFWSMAFVLHFAWFHPDMATFIVSATSDMAATIMARISRQLDINPKLQALVPTGSRRKKWNTTNLVLANGHEIRVCGMGTKQRGFHPDLLIGDDILTDETAWSETVRKRQADYWHGAVTPMLNPGRQQIVVCTPQAQNDLIMGDLRINPEYNFKSYPAIKDGVALWPERLSLPYLGREKAKMGATRFSKEYLCLPVSDEASLFPMSLYAQPNVMQHDMVLGLPADYWRKRGCVLFMGVDFAMSSAVGADYTVIWTIGIDKNGVQWIVDINRSHGLPYNEQEALIMDLGYKYRPAVMLLESNQAQRIYGDELIRKTDLPIRKYTTGAEKHALDKGVPSLLLLLENAKLRIPRGDQKSRDLTDIWMEEMHNFTFLNGKVLSVGAHDDTVFAFWLANLAARGSTFSFSFGDAVLDASQTGDGIPEPYNPHAPAPDPNAVANPQYDPFGFGF
ncbi:MAG: hypothetical protein EOO40_00070 [Deltaproteobacteria bacterium]|nr:MAG: hypothetical protein EOO40_00070 [Deltaproteobacteria bacterium]